MSDFRKARDGWVAWISQTLHGPRAGPEEELSRSPLDYYCAGVLTPVGEDITQAQDETIQDLPGGPDDDADTLGSDIGEHGQAGAQGVEYLPSSSVGLTFMVTPDIEFEVIVRAGRYRCDRRKHGQGEARSPRWRRDQLDTQPGALLFAPPASPFTDIRGALQENASVNVRWRPHEGNWLVTVALINRTPMEGGSHSAEALAEACFFQTELVCAPTRGSVLPYPRLEGLHLTEEEEELELQYRDKRIFAIGHGVAADWTLGKDAAVQEIRARFLPAVEVPLVTMQNAEIPEQAMELAFLARCEEKPEAVIGQLQAFVDRYAEWVSQQEKTSTSVRDGVACVAARISERQRRAVERMRVGCKLLEKDAVMRRAFSLAQEAMRQQMTRVCQVQGEDNAASNVTFKWRPFQIAFVLLALESVLDPESCKRDCVDLLWFPTGGGKTEAYLALIAILVLYRRLRWPASSGGTVVIMRYTLRLLTAQQFQRATALICALEQMRRNYPKELGEEPITGGLWVGGASTPNTNREALEILSGLQRGQQSGRGLFLDQCPWCGTSLFPQSADAQVKPKRGVRPTNDGIEFFCCNDKCVFHNSLPLHVVDEYLYQHPPTLLLATVDKFARLTWEDRASAFLGQHGRRPPELIIQDELHLIAGPLGSFAGLYEAAIDTVLEFKDVKPKYIASTATIRHARQQVQFLYGREMAVFPPPGHSCDDSFFARTDRDRPGRLYLGLCGDNPLREWRETLAHASAASLFAPQANDWKDELLDAWWTLVIYHGSLRGVGLSHLLAQYKIPEELRQLEIEDTTHPQSGSPQTDREETAASRLLYEGQVLELTSRVDAAGIQDVLRRLRKPCEDTESVSMVLCTNMLSVGIDISRLALMIVNGQPLTTAEYIQASSRVGRDRVPGIVITNYNRRRPRDLSHFENFRPYHESFYRFVEPTSVTPFSAPARYRALHAALVILMRHGVGLLGNADAFKMKAEEGRVRKAIEKFLARCHRADPAVATELKEQVQRLMSEWDQHKRSALLYRSQDCALPGLLRNIYEKPPERGLWETMQSMRSVDRMSHIRIVHPRRRPPEGRDHVSDEA